MMKSMFPKTTQNRSQSQNHLVTFRLDKQVFSLPIAYIDQIVLMVKIIPLPQVNQVVEGVINVRGELVPVIALASLLGYPKTPWTRYTPIILMHQANRKPIGLIVDEMLDVFLFSDEDIISPQDILPDEWEGVPFLSGLIQNQDQTLLILDPTKLFLVHHQAEGMIQKFIRENEAVLEQD